MPLLVCPSCSRHVQSTELRCPFCGHGQRAASAARFTVAAACLCAASCKPAVPEPAPGPSSSVSAASATPAASASADLGRFELGRAAVYGAPPPPASAEGKPRGVVNLEPLAPPPGAPANNARVLRGMIPGFRACYNRALQTAPGQAAKLQGKLRLTLHVAAGGEVTAATLTPDKPELASAVACIRARALAALFEGSGQASVLTADLTLALAP